MSQMNLLIAKGGGYKPPKDFLQAKRENLAAQNAELELQGRKEALAQAPEDIAWQRKARRRQSEDWAWQDQMRDWQRENRPMEKSHKALSWLRDQAPMINWENYPESREYLIKNGVSESIMPEPQKFIADAQSKGQDPATAFEEWKQDAMTSMADRIALLKSDIAAKAKGLPKVGEIRKVPIGKETVTEEWDGETWKMKARAPRWNPKEGPEKEPLADKQKRMNLDNLRKSFFNQINQYNSAARGVGQFVADPNKEKVASESMARAQTIAQQYVALGGDPKDLGLETVGAQTGGNEAANYATPGQVRADYKAGKISKEEAAQILKAKFGYK